MNSVNPHSPEGWIARNLENGAPTPLTAEAHYGNFRLHALPMMLVISALVTAAMWYQEAQLELANEVDRIGYPMLLAATVFGALFLKLRPESLRAVIATVFVVYILYMLTGYYHEMLQRIAGEGGSSYELLIIALWLPFGYVGSFVFLSPRRAIPVSLAIYAAVSLPQWMLLAVEVDQVSRQIAIAILISQPVYIAALWGVGLLKLHASGTHDLARKLSMQANVDQLTGLANRHAMTLVLETLTTTSLAEERPVSLIMFDVDNFKQINDSHGHAVGDQVLRMLAQVAHAKQRSSDLVGRWGGEEFMILALDEMGAQAMQMAERLRGELEAIEHLYAGTVTVSMGVTTLLPGEDLHAFIHRADLALYQAKASGRNRVEGNFGA